MKTFVIANWKMNPSSSAKAEFLFNSIKDGLENIEKLGKKTEIVICPPFPYLSIISNIYNPCLPSPEAKATGGQVKSNIKLGAQNCFWEDPPAGGGSFTGEISLLMLKDLGCKYVIIGHSERRMFLNETDRIINKKIRAVLAKRIEPILCVGENRKDKEQGKTQTVLRKQIENGLKRISKSDVKKIIFAYEPLWAIGSGRPCSPDEAQVIRLFFKKVISQKYFRSIADEINILYGGSVDSSNAKSFIEEAGFQGVLVGGSSLKPKEFIELVKNI
ncbi:triose-phosphate isomerase [Candidatus Parcubacteria bacterium]|nr:triose-phosphate isomerase [Candidatus Parcubacteria bacterium]